MEEISRDDIRKSINRNFSIHDRTIKKSEKAHKKTI